MIALPRKQGTQRVQTVDTKELLERLHAEYPDAECALRYSNPLELLIATILSAQCTDHRVNEVTKELFRKYRRPEDYLAVPEEELQEDIRPTGFFRNKAKHIRGACHVLLEKFGGEVPQSMDDLLQLPGVARKTANVVLGTAFGQSTGVVVDTHVRRLAQRIGLTTEKDPEKIEADLMEQFPREEWIFLGHALIWHGRRVCTSRKPACDECCLNDLCARNGVPDSSRKSS